MIFAFGKNVKKIKNPMMEDLNHEMNIIIFKKEENNEIFII